MTSITVEKPLNVKAEDAWALLRQTDRAHEAFPGVLTHCEQDGDVRTVTFAAGMSARERIIDVDDERRRLAYTVLDRFEHHSAAIRLVEEGAGSRLVWTTDFIGDSPMMRALMEAGAEAFRRAVEG